MYIRKKERLFVNHFLDKTPFIFLLLVIFRHEKNAHTFYLSVQFLYRYKKRVQHLYDTYHTE